MHSVANRMIAPQWLTAKRIVVFEDEATIDQLFPLNVLRPSWEIRAGLGTLREFLTALRSAGYKVALRPREKMFERARDLAGFDDELGKSYEPVVFLNGRLLHLPENAGALPSGILDKDGNILWASIEGQKVSEMLNLPGTQLAETLVKWVDGGTSIDEIGGVSASYVWDYMAQNDRLLKIGFGQPVESMLGCRATSSLPSVQFIGNQPVYLGPGTNIYPCVVFDTSDGPILLGEHVLVEPHCFLKGPLAMGGHGRIKAGSVLYGVSTLCHHSIFSVHLHLQHPLYSPFSFLPLP